MPFFYFDIETAHTDQNNPDEKANLNPDTGKIVTIQYQELDRRTYAAKGELTILKEWEMGGESNLVSKFYEIFTDVGVRNFIPIGKNLLFDFHFLERKFKEYLQKDVGLEFFLHKPFIDVEWSLLLMHYDDFKDWGRQLGEQEVTGREVPNWYKQRKYSEIENYVRDGAKQFIEKYQAQLKELSKVELRHR